MHRGTHRRTKVRWARSDVAEVTIARELGNLLEVSKSRGKSSENCTDVRALLHGDDSQLVFLVNPHEEGLFLVVIDTSVLGPVPVQAACL